MAPRFAAAATVSGDPLIIGSSQTLSGTGGSIAGGGGSTNLAQYSTIGGGEINAIWATSSDYKDDFIGGGYNNTMDDEVNSSVIGGGSGNAIWDECYQCVIAGGGGNVISNCHYFAMGGGTGNLGDSESDNSGIFCGQVNILSNSPLSVIAGGANNKIYNGYYSTIGGGSYNVAYEAVCTIAGGVMNNLLPDTRNSFIGGGELNNISTNSHDAILCGGVENYIGTNSPYTCLVGGDQNQILTNCEGATICGGQFNTVGSSNAVVCGGYKNVASGTNSFAAGYAAFALHDGCFVWNDSSLNAYTASSAPNQFIARAGGGFWFGTSSGAVSIPANHYLETSTGAYLTTGGMWINSSDKNAKERIAPISAAEVLQKVAELPITSWSYKAEGASVRHLGPMAQDFYAAFTLGLDDRHIGTIDEGGVALAAIQGLNEKLKEKDETMNELKQQLSALREQFASFQKQMAAQMETSGK